MSAGTAGGIVTKALRLLTVLDQKELPTAEQLAQGTEALSDMLRHRFADACSSFQIERVWFVLPAGRDGFDIGPGLDIDRDAKKVHMIRAGAYDATMGAYRTQRELIPSSNSHVFQVQVTGDTPTKFVSRETLDGSLHVDLWPGPASVQIPLQVEIGKRVPALSSPSDIVQLPPDAVFQAQYLLAKALRSQYGVNLADVADVIADAKIYEDEWKTHGRQSNFVRLRRRPA